MALDDPYSDPGLTSPSLANTAAQQSGYAPWDWVPSSWSSDGSGATDEEMRRQLSGQQQQVGPAPDAPVVAPEQPPAPEFVPPPITEAAPLPEDTAQATSAPQVEPVPAMAAESPISEAVPEVPPPDVLATPAQEFATPAPPPLVDAAPAPAPVPPAPAVVEPAAPEAPPLAPDVNPWAPTTVAPSQPDALSGGAPPTPPQLLPEQHYALTAQEYASHPLDIPDPAERQKFLNDLRARDPAAFAELSYRNTIANEHALAARKAEIAAKDYKQQIDNLTAYQEADKLTRAKSDQVWSDAQKLADTKIDPSGGITGGERIAGILMAVIGGYLQGKTGSARNIGLDALNDKINRGIEAQKAELANKRESIGIRKGALAEEYARHGDMYRAQEVVRLAALKYADNELATQQQNYTVGGTTELRIAGLRGDVQGQMATSRRTMERQDFEDNLKRIKAQQEQQQFEETRRQHADESARGWAGLAESRAARAQAAQFKQDEKAQERADKEAERTRQFSIGAPTGKIQVGADGKPVLGSDGKPLVEWSDLRNADGKTWEVASPEEHQELRTKVASVSKRTALLDRAIALSERVGGETWVANSPEYQELKQIEAEATLLKKSGTQGLSSDKDMDFLSTSGGTKDITSFRSRIPGMRVARSRDVAQLNKDLRVARYTGPALEFPEPGPETKNTPEEDKTQSLLQRSGVSRDQAIAQEFVRRTAGWSPSSMESARRPDGTFENPSGMSTAAQRAYQDSIATVDATWGPGADLDQQAEIVRLGGVARGTGPEAAAAKETLAKIAADAHVRKLSELAKQQLAPPVAPPGTYGQSTPNEGQPVVDQLLRPDPGVSRRGP